MIILGWDTKRLSQKKLELRVLFVGQISSLEVFKNKLVWVTSKPYKNIINQAVNYLDTQEL